MAAMGCFAVAIGLWLYAAFRDDPFDETWERIELVLVGLVFALAVGGGSGLLFNRFKTGIGVAVAGAVSAVVLQTLGMADAAITYLFILLALAGVARVCIGREFLLHHTRLNRLIGIGGWSAVGGAVLGGMVFVLSLMALRMRPQDFHDALGGGAVVLALGNLLACIGGLLVGAIIGIWKTRKRTIGPRSELRA